MQIIPIPAFTDNYIWMVHNGQHALVVDPGDARPVQATLQGLGLHLEAILVTHHHADHTGGVAELRTHEGAQVFGPAHEQVPEPLTRLQGGDTVNALSQSFQVIDVPGHTAGHIAYYSSALADAPALFCGDTLFSAGCGRLFEGSPTQMLASLQALAALPDATRVYCTHEYTLSNLRFARTVDPNNLDLARYERHAQQLRAQGLPTLPSTLGLERQINPFLRTREPALIASARHFDASVQDEVSVLAALRQWKNQFS